MDAVPQAATAERLTIALRRAGAVSGAWVREVVVESDRATILSRILRLRLIWNQAFDAPASLILKTRHPEHVNPNWNAGRQEVAFYTGIAPALPAGIVPRCFDAQYDDASCEWHLLLEDLLDSHAVPTRWPLPPSRSQCEVILTALARFHAAWWDDRRLGVSVGIWLDEAAMDQRAAQSADRIARFSDRLGDDLPHERRALYERLIRSAPRLHRRYHGHRNMTIGHGDAHVWNFFLPKDGGVDVRLFDWDSWRINVATNDLAYMMALHWYPDRRRRLERDLLAFYHAVLLENGVKGYSLSDLLDDYRLSVLWQMLTPVWQAAANIPPMVWWSHVQRIMAAVDDLDCRALLD